MFKFKANAVKYDDFMKAIRPLIHEKDYEGIANKIAMQHTNDDNVVSFHIREMYRYLVRIKNGENFFTLANDLINEGFDSQKLKDIIIILSYLEVAGIKMCREIYANKLGQRFSENMNAREQFLKHREEMMEKEKQNQSEE